MFELGVNKRAVAIYMEHKKHSCIGNVMIGGGSLGYDTLFKVKLYKDQAIIAFPKFSGIGIGFEKEETEWNANLPYNCSELQIYNHIKCNKFYKEIKKEHCIAAIKMLQIACGVFESIIKNNFVEKNEDKSNRKNI
jgi:hypothetical protein